MNHARFVLSKLVSRRWRYVTLVIIGGMVLLARLGFWQLDRLEQRRTENAALREALDSPPLQLAADFPLEVLTTLKDRQVTVTGIFDFSQQVFIKLQNYQGQTGGYLVAPLVIEGSNTAVLVNRGWIPDDEADVIGWAQYNEPGMVTVHGFIELTEATKAAVAPTTPQTEWYRIDVAGIANQLLYTTLPFFILQAPTGNNQTLPYRLEPEIDLSEGSHLSYAVQWFLFSLTLGTVYIVYVYKNTQ